MFWTMQGVSIWGLVLSIMGLLKCAAELDGNAIGENLPTIGFLDSLKSVLDIDTTEQAEIPFDEILQQILLQVVTVKSEPLKQGRNLTEERSLRHKRSTGFLDISIPNLEPLYTGTDERSDGCERDEIVHYDGECHQILSQGPCEDTEFVLMDPDTKKGYCAPRLCNPDRVFVFGDQKCHDPLENSICPPGRILFTSSYGSPVCGCPYGTYEEEDDEDDDVCKPVLSKIENCPSGEVFWFRTFSMEPECIPDPCKGLNAKRGSDQLPYVPSVFDGQCYQLGQELPQCPEDTFYTLSYQKLGGICASLEEAGYTVLDEEMLEDFGSLFGSRLPQDLTSPRRRFSNPDLSSTSDVPSFDDVSNHITPLRIGQSVTSNREPRVQNSNILLRPTHMTSHSPSAISLDSRSEMAKFYRQFLGLTASEEDDDEEGTEHSRRKRDTIAYASPATVFQSKFASCRAGTSRGINYKCNTKYLPNRLPVSRPKRDIPPITPYPSCPQGKFYTIKRTCVSNSSSVRNSLIAQGLG